MTQMVYRPASQQDTHTRAQVQEQYELTGFGRNAQHSAEDGSAKQRFARTLQGELDFHGANHQHGAHRLHSFPAKFPPQLPLAFIESLTRPGDVVLNPMMGSATTLLEACMAKRQAIGFDIDPLAVHIGKMKTTPISKPRALRALDEVVASARRMAQSNGKSAGSQSDERTREFIEYWFAPETVAELAALSSAIGHVRDDATREFLLLALSSTIITKSGGVSLALDLAHTRPHRAKSVVRANGDIVANDPKFDQTNARHQRLTKKLRSAIDEFDKKTRQNIKLALDEATDEARAHVSFGDAQHMPLADSSVDLIVTSPPYASNAIDYMRAHKFALVWFGYPIDMLSDMRRGYIGSEFVQGTRLVSLPSKVEAIAAEISALDAKKGQSLRRYYSEMTRVISEMHRVLKPGKCTAVVVGSSVLRGRDTETGTCLAAIGESVGFEVPHIGVRNLDRDKRMMPAQKRPDLQSQIQQRMHQEFVIGFYKPS